MSHYQLSISKLQLTLDFMQLVAALLFQPYHASLVKVFLIQIKVKVLEVERSTCKSVHRPSTIYRLL